MLSAVLNSATGEIRPDSNVIGIPLVNNCLLTVLTAVETVDGVQGSPRSRRTRGIRSVHSVWVSVRMPHTRARPDAELCTGWTINSTGLGRLLVNNPQVLHSCGIRRQTYARGRGSAVWRKN